ncbi:MAG TPA: GGDEF domain-containing protein, partial [Acidobacteriaceae bacterium]
MSSPPSPNTPTTPDARVEQVVTSMARNLAGRMDRYFSCLMVAQWLAALGVALWVTPRTWVGAVSSPNPYIAIALVFGGIVSLVPAALAWLAPGERWTRHLIAAGQMLMSTLLIHLSGGRIETHFHIFGSLAFLACYLDWTVLLTASAVILLDHTVGNFLWPHAVFGPSNVESWRWLEHVGWVVFCDAFLIATCISRMRSLRTVAGKTVEQDGLLTRAYTDALTGLPNRLRFQKQVESAVATAKANGSRFSLMYIDLDRFKEVNDTFGHALGDKVLLEVAARLTVGQNEDTMFARIGGDEFVAVCTGQGAHGAIDDRARDILTSLLSPIHIDGHDIVIGASIGVSQYPEDGSDQDQLLSHADTAMYNVKRKRRRGYTFYDDAMNATTEQRAQGQARLRSA